MTARQQLLKRAFDLVGAAVGLVILAPVLLALMAAVKLTSRGPALYRQVRIGRDGAPFRMLKLRTMHPTPGVVDRHITITGDERVTAFGSFLRRHKLDELPQLWNVLTGEMSFVGPRPDVPGYADQLRGDERRILQLRPGITGPATLHFRDEEDVLARADDPVAENDEVLYPTKTRLNLQYLDSWSFRRDLAYLLVTFFPFIDSRLHIVP